MKPDVSWWSWFRQPTYPIDHIAGHPPLLAIGTKRLCAGYDGPALNVVNPVTGESSDVFFLRRGDIDARFLRHAMAGAPHLEVAKAYDQRNWHDCIQPVPAHRPVISPAISLGGGIPIIFDGSKQGTVTNKFLRIPESLATSKGQAIMQIAVAGFRDVAQSQGISTLTRPNRSPTWGFINSSDVFFGTIDLGCNIYMQNPAPLTPFAAGFGDGPAGTMLWLDDACVTHPHHYRDAVTGGTIGQLWNNNGGYIELSALMVFGRGFDEAERVRANASLYRHFKFEPHPGGVILCDGDSITEGYGGGLNQTWPKQMIPKLKTQYRIYNTGSFGQNSANRLAYLSPRWKKFFPLASGANILVEFSGTNGLDQNMTGAQIYADLTAIVAGAHQANVKAILVTTLPRNGFLNGGNPAGQIEAERLQLNGLIRQNAAGADAIADVAADSIMGSYDTLPRKEFYFDRIHPATAGLDRIAEVIAAAVNGLANRHSAPLTPNVSQ